MLHSMCKKKSLGLLIPVVLCLALAWGLWKYEQPASPSVKSPEVAVTPSPQPEKSAVRQSQAAPTQLALHQHPDEALAWTIGFGREFWRQPIAATPALSQQQSTSAHQLPASANLHDIIQRVSHALTLDAAATPAVRASTYTAQ